MGWDKKQDSMLTASIKRAVSKGFTSEGYADIAEQLGVTVPAIISKSRELGLPQLKFEYSEIEQQCIDIAPRNFTIGTEQFESADAIIASDLHAPSINWEAFEKLLQKGAGGDLFHVGDIFNNEGLSPFSEPGVLFEDEIDLVQKIVSYWEKYFNTVIIILGNHDDTWLRKATRGQLNLPMFIRMIRNKNILVVNSTHCLLNDDWFLCHPKEYSRQPLAVGIKLANKWNKNVALGHQHNVGWGTNPNGRIVVDIGGIMDEEKIRYVNYNSASNPFWQNGFLTVRGENWHLYSNLNHWEDIE